MGERCVQLPRLLKAGAEVNTMSQHPSYKSSSASAVKRNVLKRFERVELLKKRGQWTDGDRVVGLKKTKPAE